MLASSYPIEQKQVCVLGLGYVGLPTAALLATRGYTVHGVDINSAIVSKINKGEIHIVEPELDILVKTAVDSGRLSARENPTAADVFIICVPTPVNPNGMQADLSFVESCVASIIPVLKKGDLVLLESTSPPGTTDMLIGRILEKSGFVVGTDVYVAYCPERVLPGAVVSELILNDRTVGGLTANCADVAAAFYHSYVQGTVHKSSAKVAETVKLVENTSRDVQIAFANELSEICDAIDVNVWDVIRLANRHPRVQILEPGPGVGGHCIAVDPWFLINAAPASSNLIKQARLANDEKPLKIAEKIISVAKKGKCQNVALLGMAYKSDIDDCRESPSIAIYHHLRVAAPYLTIFACEPNRRNLADIPLTPLEDCLKIADIIVILVKHREFVAVDWQQLPAEKTLLDCKGLVERNFDSSVDFVKN